MIIYFPLKKTEKHAWSAIISMWMFDKEKFEISLLKFYILKLAATIWHLKLHFLFPKFLPVNKLKVKQYDFEVWMSLQFTTNSSLITRRIQSFQKGPGWTYLASHREGCGYFSLNFSFKFRIRFFL